MKKYSYIISFILLVGLLTGAAKDNFTERLKGYLQTQNEEYPAEKTYVQTDKTYYKPSEAVWYKGFLVNRKDNKPSETSDVIYVEFIDPWGNVVQKHQHYVMDGTYNGNFTLSEQSAGGLYKLVAYTNWMKNDSTESFFMKDITVQKVITPRLLLKMDFVKRAHGAGDEVEANLKVTDLNNNKTDGSDVEATVRINGKAIQTIKEKTISGEATVKFKLPADLNTTDGILQILVRDKGIEESITRSIPIVLNKIKISFYPEGGDLIADVKNKVAFEALNEFGKGADISGRIVDEKGSVITAFESFHLGMGALEFTPQTDKKYYAEIIKPENSSSPILLPTAGKKGYVLHLASQTEDELSWEIYSFSNKQALLVGQIQGTICYNNSLKLSKGWNKISLKTTGFPIGIVAFTLFVDEKETTERLVFVNPEKELNITLETDKEIYSPLEEVELTIKTTNHIGKPVSANLGLAVVDEQILTMADDKQDNLMSYLLFSSELKGKIEEPYFYFNKEEAKAKEAIDYLLLTHGWRRFIWKEILNPVPRQINYFAEKVNDIYGYVLNKKGIPVQADVYLIETSGKCRIAKVLTTKEGQFVFHNVDVSGSVYLTTKFPNKVYVVNGQPEIPDLPLSSQSDMELADDVVVSIGESEEAEEVLIYPTMRADRMDERLPARSGSQQQLDEVVVVGYGVQKRSSVTGSLQQISQYESLTAVTPGNVTSALVGNVPGVTADMQDINPGYNPNLQIRGRSSFAAREPLILINNVQINTSYIEALSYINPGDISSISVLKNLSATALYGNRAANGVILIETSNPRFTEKYKHGKAKFGGMVAVERDFYRPAEYVQKNQDPANTTIYWKGNLQTDKAGKATVKFRNSINSSAYRITAEGISSDGLPGSHIKRIVTRKPLSVDAKLPLFAGVGDLIKIPVIVRNNTEEELAASIRVNLPDNLKYQGPVSDLRQSQTVLLDVLVAPMEAKTVFIPIKAGNILGNNEITISVVKGEYFDKIQRTLFVRQINFPYQYSFSGKDKMQEELFILPDYVEGTLNAEAISYISVLEELTDGVESIFREPYGCFEQVSSSTFPNIFALQLLKTTGTSNPDIYRKALDYLESGYNKLAAYEVKTTGGFEWYGGSPAHEVLSAYGLVEFHEMNKVYEKVDKEMMKRTLNFILSRKDGQGGFKQNRGRYGFSGAPKDVNNAYIVYALTETGNMPDIGKEYKTSLQEAFRSKDIYRMALMANAAYNMKDKSSYEELITMFKDFILKNDLSKINMQATIVYSHGDAAKREAVAFWLLALLKNKQDMDLVVIEQCVQFINAGRSGGSFGNTQATSICLQALTRYAELVRGTGISGSFNFSVNESDISYDLEQLVNSKNNKIQLDFSEQLKAGKNNIKINYSGESVFPYSVTIQWQSKSPQTSKLCPLKLTTTLTAHTLKVNETVRLSVQLQNTVNEGKPMSIAIIGIPGGMSLQPWQLKELQEKEAFDFYEIIDDNLVLYYRELGPREIKTINLDLKAEIPGTYRGVASSAYLYYMNEHKYWIDGLSVTIE